MDFVLVGFFLAVILGIAALLSWSRDRGAQAEDLAGELGGCHVRADDANVIRWTRGRNTLELRLKAKCVELSIPSAGFTAWPNAAISRIGGKGYVPIEAKAPQIQGSSRPYYDLSERAADNLDVIRRLDYSPGCELELKGSEIVLRKPSPMRDAISMGYFLRLAMPIVDEIVARGGATGIEILQDTRARIGTCQVCGGELTGRVTTCAKCATPHHAECWAYVGRCSTYGCGSTRFG